MSSLLALLLGLPSFEWLGAGVPEEFGPNDHPGAFLYEEGTVHDLSFELGPDALDALERDGPDVRATLSYRGVRREVAFKLKGSSTYRGIDDKPSIKVDIGEWVDDQTLLGVRRFTLNSMIFDSSMLREHAAYRLYRQAGALAPRHGYARVTINGEPYGLYGIVETLDEQWLRRHFPGDSEGNLYDSTFTNADLTSFGVSSFVLEEGAPLEPYADLRALVSDIDGGNIYDVLHERFDAESVLAMWAVDLVAPNWDGYSRNTNNYLLYHATVEDRWYFVPWGQDTAFGGGGSLYAGVRGRLVSACLADTACRDALEAKIAEVLDIWEDGDLLGYCEAAWTTIAAACEADPKRDGGCEPDKLLDALEDRPASIRRELGL